MVARDLSTGRVTEPVRYIENPDYKKDDGSPKFLPAEPQVNFPRYEGGQVEETVQTGYVRGGTSNPPEGSDGSVQQLDNDGKVTDVHPGEVAKAVRDEGIQAGLEALGGSDLPPGEPHPASEGSSSKKKGGKK